jgi:tellurite resistance protein
MVSKEKLYEAFGELLYAVAIADGEVQPEEVTALQNTLKTHAWAADIQWSFNYEQQKAHSVKHAYDKALDIFKEHGPDKEYAFFVEVLKLVANSHKGKAEASEQKIIDEFVTELTAQFTKDIDAIGYDN